MSLQPVPEAPLAHRAGTVAIVGRPNVGKSTLLNRLVGCKLSITSSKPQTTRRRLTGIVTRDDAQIVFVDTPGYQTEHRTSLNLAMNRSVAASLQETHAIVWVVEALKCGVRDEAVARLLPHGVPVVLAINKTDTVQGKDRLLPFIDELSRRHAFAAIVPVSAAKGSQIAALLDEVVALLPEGPPLHDADALTTVSERDLAAELLREQLFRLLGDELPYSTTVEIERFRQDGRVRRIHAAILVDKEGQKPIVIGKQGAKLKTIASRARQDMERLFGGSVYLEVWVKVRRGWADSDASLKRLGYDA
ncbi:MAG: GTPase Era [Betaproteobacteria bacterium RIFCSPLOWO2_02_FULL_67_26]|nr:MAG: GTPase Era [Betaproteobacteria bacterium RIFCSPLOWO2_02_FULL_67_26]